MKYHTKTREILLIESIKTIAQKTKQYLLQNKKNLTEENFNVSPFLLGLDIFYYKNDETYLVSFNNRDNISYTEKERNDLPIRIGQGSIVNLINVGLNGYYVNRGILLDKSNYLFFSRHTKKFLDSFIFAVTTPIVDKEYKEDILNEFENMLKGNPKELTIDKFIEKNPFILELSLHVTDLKHQIKLKNIEEEFEQDLKPDVIAFKPLDKRWVIIDYKRAKRHLIKNSGNVRSGFLAEVNSLNYQLSDYVNYFTRSRIQTKYIKDEYGIDIKYPKGIGVIGNLESSDQEALLKARESLPREIENIYPYDHIIEECRRVLQVT